MRYAGKRAHEGGGCKFHSKVAVVSLELAPASAALRIERARSRVAAFSAVSARVARELMQGMPGPAWGTKKDCDGDG